MRATSIFVLTIALAHSSSLWSQQSDWDRFIDSGDAAITHKQYGEAEESYRQALQFAEAHWKKDVRVAGTRMKLAEACNAEGKKDEAEAFVHHSVAELAEAQKAYRPKDAYDEMVEKGVSAVLFTKAGDVFSANGKYLDAEEMYQKALAARVSYAAERAPEKPKNDDFFRFIFQVTENAKAKVADAHDKLGELYRHNLKFQQAEEHFQQSLTIREKEFGADQPPVAQSLSDLAMCHALQGQYEQAEPLYKRAVTILENSKLRVAPETAAALENYALVLKKTGRDAEAQPFRDRAREIRSKLSSASVISN